MKIWRLSDDLKSSVAFLCYPFGFGSGLVKTKLGAVHLLFIVPLCCKILDILFRNCVICYTPHLTSAILNLRIAPLKIGSI